eukprot:scaffold59085_cov54-Phaeocystis_antarctica.AAC.2
MNPSIVRSPVSRSPSLMMLSRPGEGKVRVRVRIRIRVRVMLSRPDSSSSSLLMLPPHRWRRKSRCENSNQGCD